MTDVETYYLNPERINVFIGKSGSMKRIFEKRLECDIEVDSSTGKVNAKSDNSVNLFVLGNMIGAINMGHNPENALMLMDETFVVDNIDVKNYEKNIDRLKIIMGRIIGKEGITRKTIEDITKCKVSVHDHIVSVIGPYENTMLVHEALDMLIKGAAHKSLYSFLERNKENINKGLL